MLLQTSRMLDIAQARRGHDLRVRLLIYLVFTLAGAIAGDVLIAQFLRTTFSVESGATPAELRAGDGRVLTSTKAIVVGGRTLLATSDRYLWLEAVILVAAIVPCGFAAWAVNRRRSRLRSAPGATA
jgi:hypothetical protein